MRLPRSRVTHSIDSWERRCRKLLEDLEPHVDAGGAGSGPQLWAGFADHLAEALRQCRAQLHNRQETSRDVNSQLLRAVKEEGGSGSDVQVLSGWLQQAWDPDGAAQSMGIESLSMDSIIQRPQRTLQRVAGARTELLVGDWSFDALEVESSGHTVMQLVGFELLHTYASLPPGALTAFLSTLEKAYGKEHPYHSYVHAADMCNSFYFLATRSRLWEDGEVSDWIQLTSLIAALGHDVGHFGRNNVFLTSTRHALAVTYNDKSVLENFHASTLIQMLDQCYGSGSDLPEKLLSQQPIERLPRMRHLIILLILHTDPAKHLEDLSAFRVRLGAEDYNPMSHVPGCNKGDQEQAMCMLFRSADISHSAKDWNIHQEWSKRVAQEFHDQGDEEKRLGLAVSPLCDREGFVLASSQVGFLQFICVPTWKELARFEEIVCYLAKEAARSPETHAPRRSSLRLTTRGSQGTDRILSRSQTAMCHSPQPGPCSPGASPRRRRPSPITSAAPFDPKASPLELMQMGRVSSLPSESAGKMSRRSSLSSLQSEKRSSRPFLTLPARAQATAGPHHVAEAPDILERLGKRSSSGDGKLTCVCLRLCEQNLKAWTSLAEEAKPPPSPASRCA
ncbi:unnamed protein product [Prorocentrum cordatum]|uniref:Phosphodiesterase n=1 Tax=Prorocentrum cordatum TaxID=2364126 RepID=A0ABN9T7M4_9DINO|nr:unnamed protein product [Polarella glacialis]